MSSVLTAAHFHDEQAAFDYVESRLWAKGRYCPHCTTDSGELQPFDERFARMVAWQQRRHPEQSQADAEAATLAYLATMPAWQNHPRVAGRA